MSRAQSALWLATLFGLELKSLTVRETIKSGELHIGTVDTKTSEASSSHGERQSGGFEALSLEEKSTVKKIIFLLDKFCVGDSFYYDNNNNDHKWLAKVLPCQAEARSTE